MTKPERSHVTVSELAARVGLTEAAVRYHCRSGQLRGYAETTDSGSQWLIPAAYADRFAGWVTVKRKGIRP